MEGTCQLEDAKGELRRRTLLLFEALGRCGHVSHLVLSLFLDSRLFLSFLLHERIFVGLRSVALHLNHPA